MELKYGTAMLNDSCCAAKYSFSDFLREAAIQINQPLSLAAFQTEKYHCLSSRHICKKIVTNKTK